MEDPRLNLSVKFLASVKHNKLLPALTCLPVPIGLLTVVSSNSEMLNDRIPRPYMLLPFLNDSDAEFKLDPANQFTFDNEVENSFVPVMLETFTKEFINTVNPIITSTVLLDTNLVKQLNGFRNLPYAADYDLWKGILQFTDCQYIDKPLIYYDNSHGYGREYKK